MADRNAELLRELFADSDSDMESISSSEESSENGHDSGEDNLSSSDNDDAAAGPNGINATPGPGLVGRGQTGRVRGGGRGGGHTHFELPCSNYSSLVVYFTIL